MVLGIIFLWSSIHGITSHSYINNISWIENIESTHTILLDDAEFKYHVTSDGFWHIDPCIVVGNNNEGFKGMFKHLNNNNRRRLNPYFGTNLGTWTNGIIPIDVTQYDGGFDMQLLYETINEYKTKTGIDIVIRTNEADYIKVINGNGCWSYIGKQGGMQELSLQQDGCLYLDVFVHELGHGMYLF